MSAELEALLAIGLAVLGLAAIVLVLGYLNRKDSGFYEKRKAEKDKLQPYVDEIVRAGLQIRHATPTGWELSGEVDRVAFEYRIEVERRTVTLTVTSGAPGEFSVHNAGLGMSIARFFGMATNFRTGDRTIDGGLDITSSTDQYRKEIFGNPENLDRLRSLVSAGFRTVRKTPSRLSASRLSNDPPPLDALHRAVACLVQLQLPSTAPMHALSRRMEKLALFAVPIGALLLLPAGFSAMGYAHPLLADFMIFMIGTSPVAFIAWVAAFVVGRIYLRRHPMIAGTVMGWLLLLSPFLAVATFGVLVHVNERFDPGEAQIHEVPQLRNYVAGQGRSVARRLRGFRVYVLDSWPGSGVVNIETTGVPQFGGPARDGQLWQLRVRAGLLGQPWIESAQPVKP